MAYVVPSGNSEESFNTSLSPDPDPDNLRGGTEMKIYIIDAELVYFGRYFVARK